MANGARKPKAVVKAHPRAQPLPQDARMLQTPGGETVAVPSAEDGKTMTAALVMVGIALFQPELIAGMVVGAGLMYASRWMPDLIGDVIAPAIGGAVGPVAANAVKMGYATIAKTQELVSQAVEGVEDMMAEARAATEGSSRSTK